MRKQIFNILIATMLVFACFGWATPAIASDAKVPLVGGTGTGADIGMPYQSLDSFLMESEALISAGNDVWYVDSSKTASGDGKSWTYAVTTVDAAINLASAGDVICVAPGHAESYTAANGFDADVAGITIIGYGSGAYMPTFTFADTDATVAVGAANVTLYNLRFKPGISDVVMGVSIEAAGDQCRIIGCDFAVPGTATFEFLDVIDVAALADNLTVQGCTYRDGSSSACNHFIEAGAGVNVGLKVLDNDIFGRFAVSAIWSDTADTGCLIAGNVISNTITGQHCVEFTSTATGAIVDNRLYGDTIGAILDPGSMYCNGNLAATAIDEGGLPIPAIGDSTDNYIGTNSADNDAATTSVVGNADGSVLERQEYIQAELAAMPQCVVKTGGIVPDNTTDDLFVIAGGPVRCKIVGLVTTTIGGAANGKLQITTTAPAATVELNAAAVAIDADAAGTIYQNIGATSVFTPSDTLGVEITDPVSVEETEFILTPGTVKFHASATQTGAIAWYMTYVPLSPLSTVTVAP